jgi:hypothetical protein
VANKRWIWRVKRRRGRRSQIVMAPLAFVVPLFVVLVVILAFVDACSIAKGVVVVVDVVVGLCVFVLVFVLVLVWVWVLLVFHRMVVPVSLLGHTMTRPGRIGVFKSVDTEGILAMRGNERKRRGF